MIRERNEKRATFAEDMSQAMVGDHNFSLNKSALVKGRLQMIVHRLQFPEQPFHEAYYLLNRLFHALGLTVNSNSPVLALFHRYIGEYFGSSLSHKVVYLPPVFADHK